MTKKDKAKVNAAVAVTASASAGTKKQAMKWTGSETRRLIEEFTKQKRTRKEQATGGGIGMSGDGWTAILGRMNKGKAPGGVFYNRDHLQNKIPPLAKDYKSYEFLLSKTGLGLDPITGAFTGSDSVKAEILLTDKNSMKFFKAPLANYDLLDALLR